MADRLPALVRHAEPVMGTVVSFAVRADGRDRGCAQAVQEAVTWLHAVDARFSPYRADSEVSRLTDRTLADEEVSADLRTVLALCEQVTTATGGAFTAWPWSRFDPSGLVKGWAVERAAQILAEHGFEHHVVAGGGDVQLHGLRADGRRWVVGIADPLRPGAVLSTVAVGDGAVATSGTAERGAHVFDPRTGTSATALASVSLVGESLTLVDAYATAALAMGPRALDWVRAQDGLQALTVAADGTVAWTPGWPGSRPDPARAGVRPGWLATAGSVPD